MTEPLGNGVIAERIERVRDDLDVAINGLSNADPRRKVLLRADASLRQLKRDIDFPNAGLGGRTAEQMPAMPLASVVYDKPGRCLRHDTVLIQGFEEMSGKYFCFPCEEVARLGVCSCGHGEGMHSHNFKGDPKQFRDDCRKCACENYRPTANCVPFNSRQT